MTRPQRFQAVGARVASVTLLLAGVAGGVQLVRQSDARDRSAAEAHQAVLAAEQATVQREAKHAADRAARAESERTAALKASTMAKTAAADARKLEAAQKQDAAEKKAAAERAALTGPVPYTGTIPASCQSLSGSREIGCALMIKAGFEFSEFSCLNKLWDHESGWNYKATNRSSGAYGIPQAYPGDKMGQVADDWRINPATQITWGLGYIKGRYDSPCGAWNHFQSAGSY
ncbi:lytic transglycosylase domain-containing protein [Actinoplanes sp. NPDC026670]|uniref:aggregation-promoting factor C-terminal-like domain-containing protein n=1 Tax=Actinoplanes sp. NPDC026670 TaxID=3154700 RepID=UPI00340D2512